MTSSISSSLFVSEFVCVSTQSLCCILPWLCASLSVLNWNKLPFWAEKFDLTNQGKKNSFYLLLLFIIGHHLCLSSPLSVLNWNNLPLKFWSKTKVVVAMRIEENGGESASINHLIFAYYVTGHGFGHATRVVEVFLFVLNSF